MTSATRKAIIGVYGTLLEAGWDEATAPIPEGGSAGHQRQSGDQEGSGGVATGGGTSPTGTASTLPDWAESQGPAGLHVSRYGESRRSIWASPIDGASPITFKLAWAAIRRRWLIIAISWVAAAAAL